MTWGSGFMGQLVFWIGSIIETYIFNELNSKKLYKDLADRGYKVKIIDDGGIYLQDVPFYLQFIPFVNIMAVAEYILRSNITIDETIFYFQSESMILPLTESEKAFYRLNPTVKTAINIAKEDYLNRKYGNSIILQSELGDTKIVYFYNFKTLEVEVFSCEGHFSTLSREDLDEVVNTILEVNLQERYDYYGGDWGYYHAVMDGKEKPSCIIVQERDYMIDDILENSLSNTLKNDGNIKPDFDKTLTLKLDPKKK